MSDIVYTTVVTALMTWVFDGNPLYGLAIGLTPIIIGRYVAMRLAKAA